MKLTAETFFEVLFECKPKFFVDLSFTDEFKNTAPALYFSGYDSPALFYQEYLKKSDEITFKFKNQRSLNKINDQFLLNYLEKLENCVATFHKVKYNSDIYNCQKESVIDHYLVVPADSIKYEDLGDDHKKAYFEFNQSKYTVLSKMIEEFEEIIQLHSPDYKKDTSTVRTSKKVKPKETFKTKVYSIDEIAEMFHVTKRTIYNWKDDGTLPFTQIGSKLYVTQEQLDELLVRHQIKPIHIKR